MSKRVAIVQSSYIPWKGYFDLIRAVDEFVLYDDTQYTKRDWRSRNLIKTPNGLHWLTVPVEVKGKFNQRICETRIAGAGWAAQHLNSLRHAYSRAPFFADYRARVELAYAEAGRESLLSRSNHVLLLAMCEMLGITTPITWSSYYEQREGRSERLLSICQAAGAARYLSGPAARGYLDTGLFEAAKVGIDFADYSGYREYPQLHGPFEHAVTALDLIFNVGSDAPKYLKAVA